jgi:hypothetical protein
VLIDGRSGLNLIFASTLRKMGLDLTDNFQASLLSTAFSQVMRRIHLARWFFQSPSARGRTTAPSSLNSKLPTSNFLSCHIGPTGTRQIHGSAALRLFASQDARTKWSTHSPSRLEEVICLQPGGNPVCIDYARTRCFTGSTRGLAAALRSQTGNPYEKGQQVEHPVDRRCGSQVDPAPEG